MQPRLEYFYTQVQLDKQVILYNAAYQTSCYFERDILENCTYSMYMCLY